MNCNKLLIVLERLGIRRVDAEVYIHLEARGPKKGRELSKELRMNKQPLYRSLKRLRKKGLVKASLKRPASFTAVTIEDVLDSFGEAKLEEARVIKEKKDELLARWQSLLKNDSET